MAQTGEQLDAVPEDSHQPLQQEEEIISISMTNQSDVQLPSIDEEKPLSQQQQLQRPQINRNSGTSPKKPRPDLFSGPREDYLKIGVPLYEASIKCDWKAAKAIFDEYPNMALEKCSITENEETALHVAASAKGPKHIEEFVKNLVNKMERADLELPNKNHNTALSLAAAAGNIKAVKIMMEKNNTLLTIANNQGMTPLYMAALFGNEDVVKYLYNNSKDLRDDCWTDQKRSWLLEKCVENNMFDVALKIVETYPKLGYSGSVLRVLARKPEAFPETKINIISRAINQAKHIFSKMIITHHNPAELSVPFPEMKSNIIKRITAPERDNAFPLLRFIWKDIAKQDKDKIDEILRGQPDSITQDNTTVSGWAIAMQLQNLISEHVAVMKEETQNIITRNPDSTNQDTVKVDKRQQLQKLISERLVNLHAETEKIIKGGPNSIKKDKSISSKRDQALELQNHILEYIAKTYDKTQEIIKKIRKEDQALQLQTIIFKHTEQMETITKKVIIDLKPAKKYSSRVLFLAAEMGNTNFLVELIRLYPDLIWKVNDDNQSIFHIAVKHRHEGIYNLLFEIGAMKDMITPLKDLKDNNMLHLVGKIAKQKQLEDVSGVALQMQKELLWFEEVKNMIPPSYRERVNEDGLTPHELFTKEHNDLVTKGEKWMKGTSNQCMVVAALIATIVFAAAFTVPGGYDQNDGPNIGIPVFHSNAAFWVFVVADAISLFLSCASILIFLSILTSRYAEGDFLESIPKKLISGLLTLFLSITTMTVAFGVSFFVLYHKGLLWMPILICVFAVLPVILYIWLQYGLFSDVIRSTYRSRYLFKPKKHVLYYENPMV